MSRIFGLLIRRSLVRAQVGEPISARGRQCAAPNFFGAILEGYWKTSNIQYLREAL